MVLWSLVSERKDSSEETRHTARGKLVESSVLDEKDRLWSPGDPLEWASRGYTVTGSDYLQDVSGGRSHAWKRRFLILNILLAVMVVGFLTLLYVFMVYGPDMGEGYAIALIVSGLVTISVAALWAGRSLDNMEHGFRTPSEKVRSREDAEDKTSHGRRLYL